MAPAQTGFYTDFSDFEKGFSKYVSRYPEAAADALHRQGPFILEKAITEEPKAPHRFGALWRSQRTLRPVIRRGEIFVFLGFDIEYAARLHEGLESWNWTLPGSGPKYLETKLARYATDVVKRMAEELSKFVRRGLK